jgi:hypothetical protein
MKRSNRRLTQMDADENQKGKPRTDGQTKDSTANENERRRIKSPFIRLDSCAFAVVSTIVFICVNLRSSAVERFSLVSNLGRS